MFGCYALISIGWHLLTLSTYTLSVVTTIIGDVNDAQKELLKQIDTATADLKKRGLQW